MRTHLSGLVNPTIVPIDSPCDASKGLTESVWKRINKDGIVTEEDEIMRLVYYGGVQHEIRKEVFHYSILERNHDKIILIIIYSVSFRYKDVCLIYHG